MDTGTIVIILLAIPGMGLPPNGGLAQDSMIEEQPVKGISSASFFQIISKCHLKRQDAPSRGISGMIVERLMIFSNL